MDVKGWSFETSMLIPDCRAKPLYEQFIESLSLPGDVAECGVYDGRTSREFVKYLHANRPDAGKVVHLFDSFQGLPDATDSYEGTSANTGAYASPESVARLHLSIVHESLYEIHAGWFHETFPAFTRRLCFIYADADLYQSTVEICELAHRCLVRGGRIVFDDYDLCWPGVKKAIDEHLAPLAYEVIPDTQIHQCVAIKQFG